MSDQPIRTTGLTKHYGDVRALVDLDLELHPGEVGADRSRHTAVLRESPRRRR